MTYGDKMKARGSRMIGEQSVARLKTETLANGPANAQQTSAQAIRKRRSSINVYDQPSSLNARLRQLETDMLRLDEDRTKLYDDTHSALAQFELKLNEIQAILKSRQDNAEKYVEDMRVLLQARDEFERHAKQLHEKHERMQDKFMHRETTVSRDIKLLKNKFDLLEKNRQFKVILQKSNQTKQKTSDNGSINEPEIGPTSDGVSSDANFGKKMSEITGFTNDTDGLGSRESQSNILEKAVGGKTILKGINKPLNIARRMWNSVFGSSAKSLARVRRKSNRVGSVGMGSSGSQMVVEVEQPEEVVTANSAQNTQATNESKNDS